MFITINIHASAIIQGSVDSISILLRSQCFHIHDNSHFGIQFQYQVKSQDPEIDGWNGQNLVNQRKNQPIRCFYKKIRVKTWRIFWRIGRVLHNFIESVSLNLRIFYSIPLVYRNLMPRPFWFLWQGSAQRLVRDSG